MTGTEDRLAQALRARTDLITHDRLTPSAPPVAAEPRPPWRRPALYALAAAACAGAIVLPFVLSGGDGNEPGPVETPTVTASTTPSPGTSETTSPSTSPTSADGTPSADGFPRGASPFADRTDAVIDIESGDGQFTADLDGGGDETIRLYTPGDVARLTVDYNGGETASIDLESPNGAGAALPTVHTTLLDAKRRMLVVRWGGTEGVTQVYDASNHELRLLPFTSSFGSNQDEEGGSVWSVLTTDGSFYALHRAGEEAVDVYRWEIENDGVRAAYLVLGNQGKALGRWCSDGPSGWVTCT